MKSLILATGLAARLQPFTGNVPKSLMEVAGKSILDRLLADIDAIDAVDGHLIVTNESCYPYLKAWLVRTHFKKPITLVNNGMTCNLNRDESVCGILYAVEKLSLKEDVLIVGGGTVADFSFRDLVGQAVAEKHSYLCCYREQSVSVLKEAGVVTLDENQRVIAVHDCPQVPPTEWAVAPFLFLRGDDVDLMYKEVAKGSGFETYNRLLAWLSYRAELYGWVLPGPWFNVVDDTSYKAATALFRMKRTQVQT